MAEKFNHTKEWTRIAEKYSGMAMEKSINDPFYYRSRCIQGLLDGTTYNYN